MLRYGIISEVNYREGTARVNFDELGIVSGWLSMPDGRMTNRYMAVNDQVAVLMHDDGENGEILHTVASEDQSRPAWMSEDVEGYQFRDGSKVTYNSATGVMTIDAPDKEIVMNCAKLKVNGAVEATGDVTAGAVSLKNHTHPNTFALAAGSVAVSGTITINKP